jgi:hypothetical protein
MSAPTTDRPGTDSGDATPGPAEVLAALARFSTAETLTAIDRQVDEAYRVSLAQGSPAPLQEVLDHWWRVVRVARGEIDPPMSPDPMAQFIARWEAAHPGERLPR